MSQSNVAPTENSRTEIGLVFEDERTNDLRKVVYADGKSVLTRDERGHTSLTPRSTFETLLGTRYSPRPDATPLIEGGQLERLLERREEYEQRDGRKARHKADALAEAVEVLTGVDDREDRVEVPFEEIDGIGPDTAARLRSRGFETRRDVRAADDEDLLEVSGVGAVNVANIRDYVE